MNIIHEIHFFKKKKSFSDLQKMKYVLFFISRQGNHNQNQEAAASIVRPVMMA